MEESRFSKAVLHYRSKGKRVRGRPRRLWKNLISQNGP